MNLVVGLAALIVTAPDPLIAEVVAGHRANFERIRTMRAVFSFRSQVGETSGVLEFPSLVYLRDAGGVLVRDGSEGRKVTEHALLEGETRRLGRVWPAGAAGPRSSASRLRSEGYLSSIDLWQTMGGTFQGDDLRPHALGVVAAESDPPAAAARSTRDGLSLIRLTTHRNASKGSAMRCDWWFDPARGYVLVRSEWSGEGGSGASDWSDFKPTSDGVWFPKRHVLQASQKTGNVRAETTISELAINQPLPAGGTVLPLPAGTVVKDELRGTEYTGNPDWTPAGPEKRWQKLIVPAAADPGPDTGPTQAEPVGWSRWLLYAAAAAVAVGLAGLGVRKLLARRRAGGAT